MIGETKKVLLIVSTALILGGAERRLSRVFSRIKKANVFILVYAKGDIDELRVLFKGFLPTNFDHIHFESDFLKVLRFIIVGRYDWIVYCNESGSFIPYAVFAKFTGAQILWIIANYKTAYNIGNNLFRGAINRFYVSLASHIDCLYPSALINFQKKVFNRKPITITPMPFTDLSLFYPQQKNNTIVFAARLEKEKGWELFLNAIKICVGEIIQKEYEVFLCGSGSQYKVVENQIIKMNLSNVVSLKGHIPLQYILRSAKIFLSLQSFENYPSQSLLEAIATGCIIIATDVGDTNKVVKPDFGKLVAKEPEHISNAIISIMRLQNVEQEVMSRNATSFAKKHFIIEDSIRYFEDILSGN